MHNHLQKNDKTSPASFHLSQISKHIPKKSITERIDFKSVLRQYVDENQYIIGFSDLTGLITERYSQLPNAITIGLRLDDKIIDAIVNGPTQAYYAHYLEINEKLSVIARLIQSHIKLSIYAAMVIDPTMNDHAIEKQLRTHQVLSANFSHKMAATRSGLGWIGKSGLFISRRFGARLRLVTILTNYPLSFGTPVEESQCGDCDICVNMCPGNAASGSHWNPLKKRDDFFDAYKCLETCRKITKERLGVEYSICGICLAVCPVGKDKSRC